MKKIIDKKLLPFLNLHHVKVLQCIMNNPGIVTLKISKKTKIPQSTVYRVIADFSRDDNQLLTSIKKISRQRNAKPTLRYSSIRKNYTITINKKWIRLS